MACGSDSKAAATANPAPSAADLPAGEAAHDKDAQPDLASPPDNIEDLLLGLAISTPPAAPSTRSPPANRHALNNTRESRTRPSTARDRRRLDFDGAL